MEVTNNLSEHTALVRLTLSSWGGVKTERGLAEEVASTKGAERKMVSVSKKLVRHPIMKDLQRIFSAAREYHNTNTLPWNDGALRILPTSMLHEYLSTVNRYKEEADALVARLVDEWDDVLGMAKRQLGDELFRVSDYPSSDAIARKFYVGVQVMPTPSAGDWRIDIGSEQLSYLNDNLVSQYDKTMAQSSKILLEKIATSTQKLLSMVEKREGRVYESIVEGVRECASLARKLNIAKDPEVDRMADEVEEKLCKYPTEAVRGSFAVKEELVKEASAILDKFSIPSM